MFSPEDYDFELPAAQIAQEPAARRRDARLLGLTDASPRHLRIDALPELLAEHEAAGRGRPLVVINDSRVVPARVHLRRLVPADALEPGRRFELLIVAPAPIGPGGRVSAWVRGAKKLRVDDRLGLRGADGQPSLIVRYLGRDEDGPDSRACLFEVEAGELIAALEDAGELPLPPYIARPEGPTPADRQRYQTVFARAKGSVAAPTAGLHLDEALLASLDLAPITLHVGPGTFLPMDAADVRDHRVGAERYEISAASAAKIEDARAQGRPILAVGTTATRTLESVAARHEGRIVAEQGITQLVITPGHRFAVVDLLLTNFHLPRSSLLMLVCSFAGRERVLAAYAEAVAQGYRFYSYGDCMLASRAQ
ncbi:tRNA preQ1(34) S-adenosylmethionine ribosyltransferase-isomerase QueA [Pseudenhygromyxa sp. WMMC2535]|uniref:tRNA preQ1(34) S-adenosylmethionine ribosyltransferase-isomerase QueA n=1 Tax=Pseudenhygromyxa sp. WMMC2535 TaxID=2712867 RepID=UPI001554E610|nr:tRNA preQ1(34) S-adenosylmethionine ribosyltransferase-isomerase QueA [Pseudenhygromyxa sp. WMMC2535]NVB41989.1 tRNA preQ1(34) S-adenosylmethionine ribosyltransferase-isomerase QueA [Pseudenhygromyxa sp. WMMC2535]